MCLLRLLTIRNNRSSAVHSGILIVLFLRFSEDKQGLLVRSFSEEKEEKGRNYLILYRQLSVNYYKKYFSVK
ncbi:hypothetical protein Q1695_012923 [Nippostrongylus brasiliensis]|nr:hypothetical protein Q1695_012923 [Nippostrongylus brasiliensis]